MPGRTSTLTWIGVPCAVLLLAACSSDGSSAGGSKETESTSGQETTVDTEPAQGTALGCGQPFQPPTAGPLTLTAQFPATVGRESEPVTGSVDVTSATALRGVGLGRAEYKHAQNVPFQRVSWRDVTAGALPPRRACPACVGCASRTCG
jgi:hypothetical protein